MSMKNGAKVKNKSFYFKQTEAFLRGKRKLESF